MGTFLTVGLEDGFHDLEVALGCPNFQGINPA